MKVFLLTTLLLFSINGFAFNWKKVHEDDLGNFFYVDVDNIKQRNGLVYSWILEDYLEPIRGDLGNANSSISKYKVDCEEGKTTTLNSTFYSQSMGKGSIIVETSTANSYRPKPNEVQHTLMKSVCNYAR